MKHTYTIVSHDTQFQRALIDFLNDYKMVEEDSTRVHVAEGDGLDKIEWLRAYMSKTRRWLEFEIGKDADDDIPVWPVDSGRTTSRRSGRGE